MSRTRKLFNVVLLLLIAIIVCIIIPRYDDTVTQIKQIINIYSSNNIKIPSITNNPKKEKFKTVKQTDNFEPKNMDDLKSIYYTVLNNGWDDFTFYCPKEYENCYNDVTTLANSKEFVDLINNYVSPYNTCKTYHTSIEGNVKIRLTIERIYTEEEIISLKVNAKRILNELNINKNNVDKEDLRKIHNYLISNITYDLDYVQDINNISPSSKAIGAITNGKAVCSGYTDLFAILLDELNIPNFKVASDTHIWNVVYFDNEWLHVDVTWDDDEVNNYNSYNFFLITTDKLISKDVKEHNFKKELYLELN